MAIKCFEKYGKPKLQGELQTLVDNGMNEYEAARQIFLREYKQNIDDFNKFKDGYNALVDKKSQLKKDEFKEQQTISEKVKQIDEKYSQKEPPAEPVTEGEKVGIKHAETEKIRKELDFGEYERDNATDEELEAEANRLIAEGYDVEKLIQKIEKGVQPTGVENKIILKHLAGLKFNANTTKSKEDIDKVHRVVKAMDKIGSIQSEAFRTRKVLVTVEDNYADFVINTMEDLGVDELTEEQEKRVRKEYDDYEKAKADYAASMKEAEETIAKLKAENELLKQKNENKKTAGTKKIKTHEERVKERTDAVAAAREALKKLRTGESGLSAVPLPGIPELVAIAPHVKTYFSSLAGEYLSEPLSGLVKRVYNEFKDVLEGITEKDIHNIIAGEYDKKKKQTKSELQERLRDLRDEAGLINRYEALLNGEVPKSEEKKTERNREIRELKQKISEHDITKLESLRKRNESEINKIKQQLDKGDYAVKEKKESILENKELKLKYPALYNKVLNSKDALLLAREDRAIARMKDMYSKRGKEEKALRFGAQVLGVFRVLKSSFDVSMPFRQGLWGLTRELLTLPIGRNAGFKTQRQLLNQFIDMYKALGSETLSRRIMADIHESERFELAQDAGLSLADPESRLAEAREESFGPSLVERIPFVGKPINISDKIPLFKGKIGGLTKASERAATTFVNKMKWDIFNSFVDQFEAQGKTFKNSPEAYKRAAIYANQAVGRGFLGKKVEQANVLTSRVFFSLRLQMSRIQLLTNFLNPRFYAKAPKEVRQAYFSDMAKFVGLGMAILGIYKLITDDDEDEIENNPLSSDFGKIKIGRTRYDMWGGFAQYVVLFSRLFKGESKSPVSGNVRDVNRAKLLGNFTRSKLSPEASATFDLLYGENYDNTPTSLPKEAIELVTPLMYSDISDVSKDASVQRTFISAILVAHGLGMTVFDNNEKSSYTPEQIKGLPALKLIQEKGIDLPVPASKNMYPVTEDKEHPEGNMTDAEYDSFVEEWKKTMINKLKGFEDEIRKVTTYDENGVISGEDVVKIKDLSPEDLKEEISELKDQVTKEVRAKLNIKNKKTRAVEKL